MRLGHVREVIREKMREMAPILYWRLEAAGELDAYVEGVNEDICSQVVDATIRAGSAKELQEPAMYLDRIRRMEQAENELLSGLLAELDFSD